MRGSLLVFTLGSFLSVVAPLRGAEPVATLIREIDAGLVRRGITNRFAELETFIGQKLDASAGTNSWSDKTGVCRLDWVDHLLRHPRQAIVEADQFTRDLHAAAQRDSGGLEIVVETAGAKLLPTGTGVRAPARLKDGDPLQRTAKLVGAIRTNFTRALVPLFAAEQDELRATLYEQSTSGTTSGHRFADNNKGRRAAELLARIDRSALLETAGVAAQFTEPDLRRALAKLRAGGTPALAGVTGALVRVLESPQGRILVGGTGPNEYRLDELTNICAVVDLGGNDTYLEGTLSAARPVLVIIDLAGDDVYRGTQPGIQGGAILGVSVLVDAAGNDTYEAQDIAQGSVLAGIGILVDAAGNDCYRGRTRVQGQAVGGIGVLVDRAGDDDYRAAMLAQGCGGPVGVGLLDDLAGQDHYYAGGLFPSPYDDSPGFAGFSQGTGIGPRGSANGGIGVLLDGGGDDVYEADYFSHAGGYWFAAGFARDFGGNDQRFRSTRTAYDGTPRQPAPFLRYGQSFGCHYGLSFLFDDDGNDFYEGDLACQGFAWDVGIGVVVDARGNDKYTVSSSGLGTANNAGLAVLFDGAGDDVYTGGQPGFANPKDEYHPQEKSGGNFAFLIDLGGQDQYSGGTSNNVDLERGWAGGFLIDR